MNGLIALVGAGEYLPVMEEVDRYLLDSVKADGRTPRVICLATAAGQEGDESVGRWSRMGVEHFSKLGADTEALPIIDRTSADDPQYEATLEAANLIYFSGGNPIYLFETMNGSRAWAAAQKAWSRGAVYAGCSAGAMILAKRLPNFRNMGIGAANGFGVISADFVMPHFDHAGPFKALVSLLQTQMKDGQRMIGIDENTALIGKLGGEWKAMGASNVYVMTRKQTRKYASGEVVSLV